MAPWKESKWEGINVEERPVSATETDVRFWDGKPNGKGVDRYVSVMVYIFRYDAKKLPVIVMRASGDVYNTVSMRKAATVMRAAAEWIDKHVGKTTRR